jgi:hypothetical protein
MSMTAKCDMAPDFRFLVEAASDADEPRRDASELVDVAIGRGLRALDVESFASNPRIVAAPRSPGAAADTLQLEPLTVDRRPALLMLTPNEVGVRVNDRPAPRIAVLAVGDQLQIGDAVLHLTRYREFPVGPPSAEMLGRPCPVCRVPFDENTRAYVHDCGLAMHLEPESKPAEDRLECALLGDCPNCDGPISLESGYAYVPEL